MRLLSFLVSRKDIFMSNALATFEVPTFESVERLRQCVAGEEPCDLYPRDGTERLSQLEGRFAELVGVRDDQLVLCASGMAAVTGTVDSLLTRDSVLAFPHSAYSRTLGYAEWLRKAGIKVVQLDSGDPQDVERVVTAHRPTVILSETVGNGPDTPVLDIGELYDACDRADLQPTFVLDNTLPLSTGLDTQTLLGDDRKTIFVESATKAYAFNKELAGLVYSADQALLEGVRRQRQTDGFGPNVAGVEALHSLIPSTAEFDERNARVFKNSRSLAYAAFKAQGDGTVFTTSHPDLPDHPGLLLSRGTLLDGSSPVFYLNCGLDVDQYWLADQLWQSEEVRHHADLGQSFGFDRVRILPNATYPTVRISAGATTDVDAFGCALKRTLERL